MKTLMAGSSDFFLSRRHGKKGLGSLFTKVSGLEVYNPGRILTKIRLPCHAFLKNVNNRQPDAASKRAVEKGIKQIRKNPGGIILNFDEDELDTDMVLRIADRFLSVCGYNVDLMILNKHKLVCVKRYKK